MEKNIGNNWDKLLSDQKGNENIEKQLKDLQRKSEEEIRKYEVQPTPEEKEIINHVLQDVKQIAESYKANTDKEFSQGNIIIVGPDSISQIHSSENGFGYYHYYYNHLVIERTDSKLAFAHNLAHELFHLYSFRSFRSHGENKTRIHREGISIFGNIQNKKIEGELPDFTEYFSNLNEAIVSSLTKKYTEEHLGNNNIYKNEFIATEKIKSWFKNLIESRFEKENVSAEKRDWLKHLMEETYVFHKWQKILEIIEHKRQPGEEKYVEDDLYKLGYIQAITGHEKDEPVDFDKINVGYEYFDYREQFNDLIDEIIAKSSGKYSRDQVFNIFAQGFFSGNLMPAARLVENTLGEGSFRQKAEEFTEKE